MNKNRKVIRAAAVGMATAAVMGAGMGTGMYPVYASDSSVEDTAWRVIRGDYGNGADRKEALASAGYDYATIQAEVNRLLGYTGASESDSAAESVTDVAKRVIRGDYGNGEARKEALASAGYDYATVQAEVNRILGVCGAPSSQEPQEQTSQGAAAQATDETEPSQAIEGQTSAAPDGEAGTEQKSVHEIALEVIRGQYGNGEDRKEALASAGYDYAAVQAEVNRILSGNVTTETGTAETPTGSDTTGSGAEAEAHNWVPETEEITHDATYKTIHHDEQSHVEHHDAVTHEEVVTPAVTKTVVDKAAYDEQVVDKPAYDETITDKEAVTHVEHHDAITHVVHHDTTYKTVHHDAVTHVVHHDAVTHEETVTIPGKDLPLDTKFKDMPVGTTFGRICWIGGTGMEDTTPDKRVWVFTKAAADSRAADPVDGWEAFWKWIDDSNEKYGIGNWTYADVVWIKGPDTTETKTVVDTPAYDETVVDQAAYDEQVVDTPAWDETVVDKEAWDETVVDEPAVTHVEHHKATYKTVHHDAVTHEEVVTPAVTKTVVDKAAYDEVVTTPAWDETVIDQPAYTETQETGWYICTDCGLRQQM